jgi:bifunctional DNase/RNase
VEIDCRPSDAIALLVRRSDIPLLVADHVLAEAAG